MLQTSPWDRGRANSPSAQARADSTVVPGKPKHLRRGKLVSGRGGCFARSRGARQRFGTVGRIHSMTPKRLWLRICLLVPCAALGFALAGAADFEVTGPDGRRILLKDDKTWQ